ARSYVLFRDGAAKGTFTNRRSEPAGIVFHTSESVQAPFISGQNAALTQIGRDLLKYVSRHRAYHFVIDRFGRVFRVVPETDAANHAGYSVWSHPSGIYVNLNHSFLGISFEARTRDIDEGYYLSPAQINSGHLLVQMLLSKYKFPLTNCVTHAQVSVDPNTMVIGHHTDGSGDFPFQELGLPENYTLPLPSIFLFGFDCDPYFLKSTGTRMPRWPLQNPPLVAGSKSPTRATAGQ
ncbi:MAG: N-acetylmuramoyl-L-alanine amidase, partial [Acidobacteria bacterium]|nr:N-acetylmuramoyl-L-alanine amidase [Acidobacteriota bacterium]